MEKITGREGRNMPACIETSSLIPGAHKKKRERCLHVILAIRPWVEIDLWGSQANMPTWLNQRALSYETWLASTTDQKIASEIEAAFWPRHTYMHTHIWIEYMYFSIRVLEQILLTDELYEPPVHSTSICRVCPGTRLEPRNILMSKASMTPVAWESFPSHGTLQSK